MGSKSDISIKRIFAFIGVISLFLFVAATIGVLGFNYFCDKMDEESMAFAEEVIPIIVGSWNPEELIDHASPQLLSASPEDEIESVFKLFSEKLGSIKTYYDTKGQADVSITRENGIAVTANYLSNVLFNKSPATIYVRLIRDKTRWKISKFHVDSEVFTGNFPSDNNTKI